MTSIDLALMDMFGFSWSLRLKEAILSPLGKDTAKELKQLRTLEGVEVYPTSEDVFKAYRLCSLEDTKVVILGDFPYPSDCSDGLAFSSQDPFVTPRELRDILISSKTPLSLNCLDRWAMQGVFLLNIGSLTTTVYEDKLGKLDWSFLTDETIKLLNESTEKVFINLSQEDIEVDSKHLLLKSSTLSDDFEQQDLFNKANQFLIKHKRKPISW